MSSFKHSFISPSELNAFVFCKKKWYYRTILKLNFTNEDMQIGSYLHETHWQKTKKRKEQYYISYTYKLKGYIDYIITENNIPIPLEIKKGKSNKGLAWEWDIMQLICYAKMLEETHNKQIPYGYILYKQEKNKIQIKITSSLIKKWKSYLAQISHYLRSKKKPIGRNHQFGCKNCALRDYCLI
ncbi:MAG: CRISPR-associated protein Cas4 [Promethearchaeota archaeon]